MMYHSEKRIRRNHIRRQRELIKNISLFICTICMIIILGITFGSFLSKAKNTDSEATTYKYFTSILVEPGDNLYSIASANILDSSQNIESYMNEVIHINALEDETIHAGQYIIVPYYSNEFK